MNEQLASRLKFLMETVGITISQSRIDGWHQELESGSGRDLEQIWSDILRVIGGAQRDKIEKWVADRFAEGGESPDASRISRIADELISGEVTFNDKAQQIYDAMGYTPAQGANPATTSTPPKGEKQDKQGVGTPATEDKPGLTILKGKEMTWYFDRSSGKWYVGYGLPGSSREMVFEASPEDMDALFGEGVRPANYQQIRFKDLVARPNITFGGDILEMEGTGSFEAEVEKVIALALDEGRLPEWAASSPETMDIIYIAQAEGKSDEWVIEQLSKTKAFQGRFPGIEKLRKDANLTITEAVGAFLEFEAGLKSLRKQYGMDPGGIKPQHVGDLINKGYSMTQVADTYAVFNRMKEHKPALDAFNEVLKAQGKAPLTPNQQVAFLLGRAPEEIYDIYEASSLREAAVQAGLGEHYSARDAIATALYTEGSRSGQEIAQSMQQAAAMVLRMRGELNVERYGLTHDELIDISLGQPVSSGRPESEVREALDRAVNAARGFLEGGVKPFTGFTEDGRPQASSLAGIRQQS